MATPRKRRPRGTGSIFRNGNRFRAQYIDPKSGQKFSESFSSEDEADIYLRSVIADTYGGSAVAPVIAANIETMPVSEFFKAWLVHKYEEKQPLTESRKSTLEGYERLVRDWIVPKLGTMHLRRLHRDNIRDWLTWIQTTKSSKTHRLISHSQQHRIWTVFKMSMSWGAKDKYLLTNPIGSLKGISSPALNPMERAFKKEETTAFRELIQKHGCDHENGYCELRWELALVLAKRQSEILGLKWGSVHLTGKFPYVELREYLMVRPWKHGCDDDPCKRNYAGHCPKRHGGGRLIVPGSKTGDGSFYPRFPLTDNLVKLFKQHKKQTDMERKRAAEDGVPDFALLKSMNHENLVFHHPRLLTPFSPSRDNLRFKGLCKESGLENYRLHDLRHTAITYLVESSNGNVGLAQRIANHKTSLTTQMYSHPDLRAGREALEGVSKMLSDSESS